MKKILSVVSMLAFAVVLTGCGSSTTDCKATSVLVTDVGGVSDKSFNQSTNEGIIRYAEENKSAGACAGTAIQSNSEADYIPNLTNASNGKNQLVIGAGYKLFDAMTDVAGKNPNQKYLIIDSVVESPNNNVASAVFAANEGSYLVGVAAAMKAEAAGKDTVGFIGGMEGPLIENFEVGYTQGVKSVNKDMKVLVQYAGNFNDVPKGKTIANQMYDKGAYVIYHAAGNTGNGAITAAKDRTNAGNEVFVIGVDRDQYEDGIYSGDKSVILTSALKRVDVAAESVSKSVLDGTFEAKTLVYDLKNDGVGIPEKNPNLDETIIKAINEAKDKIIAGTIVVESVE